MEELEKMSNIGKVLATKLAKIGINTGDKLIYYGTENTFCKLRTIDPEACLNSLYAIEGAVRNIRWHSLPADRKEELKNFFESLK
jgi:DNA transformation protein